ncbi:hypothetical protein SEA_SATIS_182 [Streptomyces phage Satis]|nr:hypothetical protein SEA_SATIS_182 [Streptomyces phage Satis]
MSDSRHFTLVDDWVMLNPDVTATEYRVYSIIKGNLKHGHGGIPETGFRATAAWVAKVSGGIVAVSTAHKAMQGLANKGVLRRLNNPQSGEGADFEFVIEPDESYEGARSVMARAAEVSEATSRRVAFVAVPLRRKPKKPKVDAMPPFILVLDEAEEPAGEAQVAEPEPEPEFDVSGLENYGPKTQAGEPTPAMAEFAAELEAITSQQSELHLRLMTGTCRRVAQAVGPLLDRGWAPGMLARRLAAELNPRIHSPEKLLLSKARDLGDPPPVVDRRDGKVMIKGKAVDLGGYDMGFGHLDEPPAEPEWAPEPEPVQTPGNEEQEKRERLAQLARRNYRGF